LIDAWGRGTISIIDACKEAGLPEPELIEEDGGFMVTLFKDRFSEEELQKLGLNERQIKAVLYVKERGKITNAEYQEINKISRQMATNELHSLVNDYKLLINNGYGAGSYYELVN
jgi:ATP-dependent DNA helicase RecG